MPPSQSRLVLEQCSAPPFSLCMAQRYVTRPPLRHADLWPWAPRGTNDSNPDSTVSQAQWQTRLEILEKCLTIKVINIDPVQWDGRPWIASSWRQEYECIAWKNPHRSGNLYKSQGRNNMLFEGHYMSSVDCHLRRGTDGKAGKNGRKMHFLQSLVARGHIWRYRGHILTFTRWRIINRAELERRLNSAKGVFSPHVTFTPILLCSRLSSRITSLTVFQYPPPDRHFQTHLA